MRFLWQIPLLFFCEKTDRKCGGSIYRNLFSAQSATVSQSLDRITWPVFFFFFSSPGCSAIINSFLTEVLFTYFFFLTFFSSSSKVAAGFYFQDVHCSLCVVPGPAEE